MPISQYKSTTGALFLGRGFAKLEDLGIAHVGDQLLPLFAEFMNFFSLFKSYKKNSLFGSNCRVDD